MAGGSKAPPLKIGRNQHSGNADAGTTATSGGIMDPPRSILGIPSRVMSMTEDSEAYDNAYRLCNERNLLLREMVRVEERLEDAVMRTLQTYMEQLNIWEKATRIKLGSPVSMVWI